MSTLATPSEITISDIEKTVQDGLEALRSAPLNDRITAALKFLTPHGYRPVAQLEEDGRKKRSTAAASNWSPATGEIVIYFEPTGSSPVLPTTKSSVVDLEPGTFGRPAPYAQMDRLTNDNASAPSEVTALQLQQCCEALAEAEKAGKAFIALKWFRDNGLMSSGHAWADSLAQRQAVVTKAIDTGAIFTTSIPNPKAPQHPTTTVKLNRDSDYAKTVTRRFQPIRPRNGESASVIILRDRGRL